MPLFVLIPVGVVAFSAIAWAPLLIRRFALEAYRIPSPSMSPNLIVGDQLFADKTAGGRMPARGDVIIFEFPPDPTKDFISRVVAVAGDRVQLRDGHAIELNGVPLPRCELGPWPDDLAPGGDAPADRGFIAVLERNGAHRYVVLEQRNAAPQEAPRCVAEPCIVPPGHVLTLGDNRDNSYDGRFWGFVPVRNIRGRGARIHAPGPRSPSGRLMRSAQADSVLPPQLAPRAATCPADLVPRP